MNETSRSREEKRKRKKKSWSAMEREVNTTDVESTGSGSASNSPILRNRSSKQTDDRVPGSEKERFEGHFLEEREARGSELERARQRVLEKLKEIRRRAVASRDEHRRQLLVIERQVSASTAALMRAKTMREAKKKLPEFEQMQRTEEDLFSVGNFQLPSKQFPVSFSTAPALPASYVYAQSDPPQRLSYEENVLKQAFGIVKKNTALAMSRLPKQPEPPRAKVLWDYLLDEVVWLAVDFREERKHKICLAKKLVDEISCRSAEYNGRDRKKRANSLASLVAKFWKQSQILYFSSSIDWRSYVEDVESQQLYEKLAEIDETTNDISATHESNLQFEESKEHIPTMNLAEPLAPLNDFVARTEEQRDEEITALFDSVNNISSSVDPEEYLENAEQVAESEVQCSRDFKAHENVDEKDCIDVSSNKIVELQKNCFVDFGFFQKSIESFLNKLTRAFGDENVLPSLSVNGLPHFNGTLKEFQLKAVQFLASCYMREWNVLLADDTNCGKTVSVIAFLSWLFNERRNSDPCLVLCSGTEVEYLKMEWKRFAPSCVVVTSNELEGSLNGIESCSGNPEKFSVFLCPYEHLKEMFVSLRRRNWHCLILKEANNIRCFEMQLMELASLPSRFRVLLKAEHENCALSDFLRILQFLVPKLFPQELRNMDFSFLRKIPANYLKRLENKMEKAIKAFTLRRKKEQLSAEFPKRIEEIISCSLTRKQRKIYDDVVLSKKLSEHPELYPLYRSLSVLDALKRICSYAELVEPNFSSSLFVLPRIEFHVPKRFIEIYDKQMLSYESSFFLIRKSLCLLHFELYSNMNEETDCNVFEEPPSSNFLSGEEEWQQCFRFLVNYDTSFHSSGCSKRNTESMPFINESSLKTLDLPTEQLLESSLSRMRNYFPSTFFQFLGLTNSNMDETVSFYPKLVSILETERFYRTCDILNFGVERASAKTPFIGHSYFFDSMELEPAKDYCRNSFKHVEPSRYWLSYEMESNSGKLTRLRVLLESLKKLGRRCVVVTGTLEVLDVIEYFMQLNRFTYIRFDSSIPAKQRYMMATSFSHNNQIFCCIMNFDSVSSSLKFSGVDTLIYFEHCLDLKDSKLENTVYNLSQDNGPVYIFHLVSDGTVEEKMMKIDVYKELVKGSWSFTSTKNSERHRLISKLICEDNFESSTPLNCYSTGHTKSLEESSVFSSSAERDELEEYFNSIMENEETGRMSTMHLADEVDENLQDIHISYEAENNKAISRIQCYSLNVLSRIRNEAYAPMKLEVITASFHSLKQRIVDTFGNDSQFELFYARMMDDDSRRSYSQTMENSECDLKIYLPLHDGGKEELTMSTVVDKTAAIGIESAEDAAFFPYAYSRLSRTVNATRLQNAKLLEDKLSEQNSHNFATSKDADSWGENYVNRTGVLSPVSNKHLQNSDRNKARTTRRNFFDGSEEKLLLWTPDEDRELLRTAKSCYQNYMICRDWLRWTTFSLCRLKRPRTDNECRIRFENIANDSKETLFSHESCTESHLLKKHSSLLLSIVHERWKKNSGAEESNAGVCTVIQPHPSYAKLVKSLMGDKVGSTLMPNLVPSPKVSDEDWKSGYKTTDFRIREPFVRRSSILSRMSHNGLGFASQGAFRHFRQRPQRSEIYGKNVKRPLNHNGPWPFDQRSQLLNAKSLTRTNIVATMSSSSFSMRPNILTKLMRKQSEPAKNWRTDVKLSFESGANYQSDSNLAVSRFSSNSGDIQGGVVHDKRSEMSSSHTSSVRDKRQASDWQTTTNTLKRSRKSSRMDETG